MATDTTTPPPSVPASFDQWSQFYEMCTAASKVVSSLPLTQQPAEALMSGHTLTPAATTSSSVLLINPTPGDPPDPTDNELWTLPLASVAEGRIVMIGIAAAAEPVTLKHLAMAGAPAAGQGEIETLTGSDSV